jgi:hypothetical protein
MEASGNSFIYLGSTRLTHRQQVPIGLQHHIAVQGPLNKVQLSPLFLGEVHCHILEGHWFLKRTRFFSAWGHTFIFGDRTRLTAWGKETGLGLTEDHPGPQIWDVLLGK